MILPFIIAGLTTGSVYGLAGVGLVLTYKTSGVFNFAQGALATVAAYLFYTLHVQHGMAWPLAGFICVFVLGPVLGLLLEILARALANATLNTQVASTVGILLMVQAGVVLIYGTTVVRDIPPFLPGGSFDIAGTSVTSSQIVVFAVGVAATAALYGWFRLARGGVAMRAVVDNPELLDIAGTSPAARSPAGLDHRLDLRLRLGRAPRPVHQPRSHHADVPDRVRVRGRRDRPVQ